ncbi:uncharacterized protein N7483_002019 [Penicillium malachiteum]|uniref:uncharacterized protein n=1 Tax=Penicillium malachiteum TaxID=1324776 RepID=UPI002548FFCE|nr:uncharacterized protein N7483_002019 [Penicillium malachiteum]KAJ5736894.1 hypothetical protein N7483_002019 [Penicillium malachiteum]
MHLRPVMIGQPIKYGEATQSAKVSAYRENRGLSQEIARLEKSAVLGYGKPWPVTGNRSSGEISCPGIWKVEEILTPELNQE